MPESAVQSVEREVLAGEAARRRRQIVETLRLAACVAAYAADQVAGGLDPAEARVAATDAALELAGLAALVCRLARLEPGDRRVLARRLAAAGWSRREIAARLGVSTGAVAGYLRPGGCPPGQAAGTDRAFDGHSTAVE